MVSPYDPFVVVAFALVLPIFAKLNYVKLRKRLQSGDPGARSRQYRRSMWRQWGLTAMALFVWFAPGRSAAALGLGLPDIARPGFFVALGLAVGLSWLWRAQIRAALESPESEKVLRRKLDEVAPLLPTTREELHLFSGLSITAGVCEEILFRGYLIGYLSPFTGTLVAAVLSGVVFGLGHLYQGRPQAFKIVFVGWLFAAFYVGSGSLWVPMTLHALLDLAQGRLAYRLLATDSSAAEPNL